ncbi:unnamed protein product [Hymenolepis diminuta]|uniref:Uncharacterized protein n=1 Tax=Hymenolepis diminuta TaxID=6216 RepID=A0A564YZG7_HYMDI|nr:unnamed protein product [Hymenolepis diminuta]
MIVAEPPLTRLCLGTSPVYAVPSFFYNRLVQLKHTYNYVLMCVLIQVTNINSLSIHTHRDCRLSDISSFTPSFPQFSLYLGSLYCGLFIIS